MVPKNLVILMFAVVPYENYNKLEILLTSTFLETTFFTTAAKRSDMSRPSAIIYNQEKSSNIY